MIRRRRIRLLSDATRQRRRYSTCRSVPVGFSAGEKSRSCAEIWNWMIICRKKDYKLPYKKKTSEGDMGTGYHTFVQLKRKTESATIYMKMQIMAFFINNKGDRYMATQKQQGIKKRLTKGFTKVAVIGAVAAIIGIGALLIAAAQYEKH